MNIQELLLEKRSIDLVTGCWLWTGRLNNKGYGVICNSAGDDELVHRISFANFIHIPLNLVLHKTICPHKHCFNPEHLYDGTHAENMQDSLLNGTHANQYGPTNKPRCKNDHPLHGDNLIITSEGRRRCRTCQKEYNKKNWKKYAR